MTLDEQEPWRIPSPRLLTLWRLEAVLGLAVPALALVVVAAVLEGLFAAAAAMLAALVTAGVVFVVQSRRYRAWAYAERADDLLVRRGVLIRRLSVVPYGRMQFVDVLAGPLERRFGLASVHLHTAAAATDAHIPGVPAREAERLRDRLAALGEARAAGL